MTARRLALAAAVLALVLTPGVATADGITDGPSPPSLPPPPSLRMTSPVPEPSQEPRPIVCAGTSSAGVCVTDEPLLIVQEHLLGF